MKTRSYCISLVGLLFLSSLIRADDEQVHVMIFPKGEAPWFTGPLLAPSGITVPQGDLVIAPYIRENIYNGRYGEKGDVESTPNFYESIFEVRVKAGVSDFMDVQIRPQLYFNATEGEQYFNIGDMTAQVGIQLFKRDPRGWRPNARLALRGNMPLGKYKHLNPKLQGTDAIGSGSWLPTATLSLSNIWNTSDRHYLEGRFTVRYQVGTPVLVKGVNSYGGVDKTKGFIYPGNNSMVDAAIQYNFTQRWVFASDLRWSYTQKRRFSGFSGIDADGLPVRMTAPVSMVWSLAPAIEYNWSDNVGLIAGVWFSFAGKNTSQFRNTIISLNIYI